MRIKTVKIKVEHFHQDFNSDAFFDSPHKIYESKLELVKEDDGFWYWHACFTYELTLKSIYLKKDWFDAATYKAFEYEVLEYINSNTEVKTHVRNSLTADMAKLPDIKKLTDFNRVRYLGTPSVIKYHNFFEGLIVIINNFNDRVIQKDEN